MTQFHVFPFSVDIAPIQVCLMIVLFFFQGTSAAQALSPGRALPVSPKTYFELNGGTLPYAPSLHSLELCGAAVAMASHPYSKAMSSESDGKGAKKTSMYFCSAPTQFFVQYRNYIPADHLGGPDPCWIGGLIGSPAAYGGALIYLGDASTFADGYRIKQYVNVTVNPYTGNTEPPLSEYVGKTINFQFPSSPVNGLTANLSSGDFSSTLHTCYHENNWGYASLSMVGGSADSISANTAQVVFSGTAGDPLEPPLAPIDWNLGVYIDASANTATISGTHDCFPSHQILVGSQAVYTFAPSSVSTWEAFACLTGLYSQISVSCTVALDGSSQC